MYIHITMIHISQKFNILIRKVLEWSVKDVECKIRKYIIQISNSKWFDQAGQQDKALIYCPLKEGKNNNGTLNFNIIM